MNTHISKFDDYLAGLTVAGTPYGVTRLHPALAIASRPRPDIGPHMTEIRVLWLDDVTIRQIDLVNIDEDGAALTASKVTELLIGVFSRHPDPKPLPGLQR